MQHFSYTRRFVLLSMLAAVFGLLVTSVEPASAQYTIQQPKGPWQTPGRIQKATGPWQIPKGIQAIKTTKQPCGTTYSVGADALFAFDKSTLSPDAEKTLSALGPMLKRSARKPIHITGYTDAIGSAAYNMTLSEQRAKSVRDWLAAHGDIPASTPYSGLGKNDPIAPNTKPDGSDNPLGRQKNRRVEISVGSCR